MRSRFGQIAFVFLLITPLVWAQVTPTGSIVGTVYDPSGAVVPGVNITIKDATGATFTATSNAQGGFRVAQLKEGTYQVTVAATGFQTTVMPNVVVEVARTASLNITLRVGHASETVEVEGRAAVLETQDSSVTSVVTGKQITELPLHSRDANDLALMMPETQTTGRPRTSTFNGLPKATINISMDGINVQDNYMKSQDGFFTNIRPRLDAVSEFTVSSATPGAESAGEGAVQINMVTKRGGDNWHGSTFWYHRNPATNALPFFDKMLGNTTPRMLLNDWGGSAGGPIIKGKLFFFGSYDEWWLPQRQSRTPTVLTPTALSGKFTYKTTAGTNTVDMLALAATKGFPSTLDPQLKSTFDLINAAPGTRTTTGNPLMDYLAFTNAIAQWRRFPEARLDWNVNSRHSVEAIYKYSAFYSNPDNLNTQDPALPGFPLHGGQYGARRFGSAALRSVLSNTMSNELRIGFQNAGSNFYGDKDMTLFPSASGFGQIRPVFPTMTPGITTPYLSASWTMRDSPTLQVIDNVSWVHGNHALRFGVNFSHVGVNIITNNQQGAAIPNINFGVTSNDPAFSMFNTGNFPSASSTDLANARALYGLLVGRVTSLSGAVYLDLQKKQFIPGTLFHEKVTQNEWGFYGSDSWRMTPTFTVNYGLRYELQLPFKDALGEFSTPGTINGLFGASGVGNLFKPGTLTGTAPSVNLLGNNGMSAVDLNNFAPSVGIAWSPRPTGGWLKTLAGDGKSVIRAGYSVAYTRDGTANAEALNGSNPGYWSAATLSSGVDYPDGGLLLRNGLPKVALSPTTPGLPINLRDYMLKGQFALNTIDPNMRVPYVQSWTFGIQRELGRDLVVEARYVGNHAVKLLRQVDFNEVNIFENGFLSEFNAARQNLAIYRAANPGCVTAGNCSFANKGLAGQVNLPIIAGSFGSPTASNFSSGTYVGYLDDGNVGTFGYSLATSAANYCRLIGVNSGTAIASQCAASGYTTGATGYPLNFWMVNPDVEFGGNYLLTNAGMSNYNGLQLIARQRMSHGLQFNVNYTWARAESDFFASSTSSFGQPRTLHPQFKYINRVLSPFDIRQAYKMNLMYELPFRSSNAFLKRVIGGWNLNTIGRWQSGGPFPLQSDRMCLGRTIGGGTSGGGVDCGVQLVGITAAELDKQVTVRKDFAAKQVFYLPAKFIGANGQANPQYIQPCNSPGVPCPTVFLHEPWFNRIDFAIGKKTAITERVNLEFRAEFLNLLNQSTFKVRSSSNDVSYGQSNEIVNNTQFGRITSTYQDISTTNDLGSRQMQFVFRINF